MRPLHPLLELLHPLDLRAALPQRRGPIGTCAMRSSVTLHYAGTREPGARDDAAAVAQIRSEALYHINKNWGDDPQHPRYGDGIMYHLAVLPSGRPALLRDLDAELWHCGNATGNRTSISVTTLRGIGQQMTSAQWSGTAELLEALTHMYGLVPTAVLGHREWPRSDGRPQSLCPGPLIFERLLRWRRGLAQIAYWPAPPPRDPALADYPLGVYEVTARAGVCVRTGPNVSYPKADGDTLVYGPGRQFQVDVVKPDERGMHRVWLHDASGIGFLAGDPGLCTYKGAA